MSGFAGVALGVGALLVGFAAPYGNGIEDDPPQVIIEKGRQTLAEAKSLRMVANATEAAGRGVMDLRLDVDGNCAGRISSPGIPGSAEVIKRGGDVWMKPDAKFLQGVLPGQTGKDAAKVVNGRWIHSTTDNPVLSDLTDFCDLNHWSDEEAWKPPGPAKKGGEAEVDGKPAIKASSSSGSETVTYYVATEGAPYLLRVEAREEGRKAEATFSEYGTPVPAKTPAEAESVDASELP
ncbi:hypothetical protein [Streptomyces sp. NPDC048603]|uniref:hypothetical protein n=1 Tax=Streptomyces sp. NPDC048603 TaxID=3365577 RepID=UPI00371D572C